MRPEEVKELVQRYISERIDEWGDAWYAGERIRLPTAWRLSMTMTGHPPNVHGKIT